MRPTVSRVRIALAVMFAVSFFNYMDRYSLAILIEPIRKDLDLSDAEIGLLTGIAFAVAFSVAAVPIGRFSDHHSRRAIIAAAVSFWSLCTAACGFASGFWPLVALRCGVATGEAGGFSPVQSLIGDMYPKERRAGAVSIVLTGGMLGVAVGFAIAGFISDAYGWRAAFLWMGTAGLVLGPAALWGLVEPARGLSDGLTLEGGSVKSVAALGELLSRPAFVLVMIGFCIAGLAAYGTAVWVPTYFVRHFGLSGGEVGTVSSLAAAVPTVIGTFAGGVICNALAKRDLRWMVRFPGLCLMLCAPLQALQILAPNITLAATATVIPSLIGGAFAPPLFAALQTLSGARLRATGTALGALAALLIGQGLGPSLIGWLSTHFARMPSTDPERGLQWALLSALTLYLIGGFTIWSASRTFSVDVDTARAFDLRDSAAA